MRRGLLIALLGVLASVLPVSAATLYVDSQLPVASCPGYSIVRRDCSGCDGTAYQTPQAAADTASPGDTVLLRGGVYPFASRAGLVVSRSGTATQRIVVEGYAAERVILRGVGFEDRDLNGDGYPDGPTDTGTRAAVLTITGSFVTVRGVEVEQAPYVGVRVDGADTLLEEVISRDHWYGGVWIRGPRTTLRYVEAHHIRHGSGIAIGPRRGVPPPVDARVLRSLSYHNGRDATDQQVRPIPGDPAGGGNSDGMVIGKDCFIDTVNVCRGPRFLENVVWGNVDDGFDINPVDAVVIGNVIIENGPAGRRGIKNLVAQPGHLYASNIAVGLGVQYTGLELRSLGGLDVFHNLVLTNLSNGVTAAMKAPPGRMHNNLGRGHARVDLECWGCVTSHNWGTPGPAGDPMLENITAPIILALPTGTVEAKWRHVMTQVAAAYTPKAASPLIDAGLVIPGYHCAAADDDPTAPLAPTAFCRHWMGAAPDIGPFEAGIVGNPDRTGMGP